MENRDVPSSPLRTEKQTSLGDMLKNLKQNCRNCNPLTPLTCVTECKTWKLKNQLRKIHEKMQKPDFEEKLLNTLKNERRLQLLGLISKQGYPISQLQQKLKTLGFNHSKQTIVEEYINPLVDVGLVEDAQNPYHATILGYKVNDLVGDFHYLNEILPPHSECYEETILETLMDRPRTYQEMRAVVSAKSLARVMSRLQRTALVQTNDEKNYIFFFQTKRDSHLSTLSPTERRVYENISEDGISAGKLAEKTQISLRRTYKYLRKLKGKKLVFTRKKPLFYSLTTKGVVLASTLRAIRNLVVETQATTAQLLENEEADETSAVSVSGSREKNGETVALAHWLRARYG
jgi:predicted transcriptional regulator